MSLAQLHSALNDFPVALLVASVAFDLAASGPRRPALQAAAYWSLLAGAGTAIVTAVSGLVAGYFVEPEPAFRQTLLTHRVLGLAIAVVFSALAGWRLWRKNVFGVEEQQSYIVAALVGALAVLWAAHLGGIMVFEHGVGVTP
ncbi:MAG: DUF2231 domain-containing protein [Gemmatimonadetes bacterium]|nr:DUF2231 domain-containing protein [Gemmatimonadota bacterium]